MENSIEAEKDGGFEVGVTPIPGTKEGKTSTLSAFQLGCHQIDIRFLKLRENMGCYIGQLFKGLLHLGNALILHMLRMKHCRHRIFNVKNPHISCQDFPI